MGRRGLKPGQTHAGSFKKGVVNNPGGLSSEVRRARDDLNAALAKDKDEIHAALMDLVRERNPQAVMYAHQKLAGKPPAADEDRDAAVESADKLSLALAGKSDAAVLKAFDFVQSLEDKAND